LGRHHEIKELFYLYGEESDIETNTGSFL